MTQNDAIDVPDPLAGVRAPAKPKTKKPAATAAKKAAKKTSAKAAKNSEGAKNSAPRTRKPSVYVLKNADKIDPEKWRGQRKSVVLALKSYSNPKDLATIAAKAVEKGLTFSKTVTAEESARYHLNALVGEGVVQSANAA